MRGDLDEQVTTGQVIAGEAMLFGSEEEGDAAAVFEFVADERREFRELNDALLRFAMREGAGTEHERALANRFSEALRAAGVLKQALGSHRGPGFAPVRFKWSNGR